MSLDAINAALATVTTSNGTPITEAGLVAGLGLDGGHVRFVLDIPAGEDAAALEAAARAALKARDEVTKISIITTAHNPAPKPAAPPPNLGMKPKTEKIRPDGVKHIVAIASGKGGVGKSTIAANLAVALAQDGLRVGLLDADVYGPSQPRMLGVSGRPASPDGHIILPLRNFGVTLMSVGLMMQDDEAVVWRGPMLMGALQQMLSQVQWGALDVLLVDLPPGTGDVQMTLAQKSELAGAVIVSTPQDIALLDVKKGMDMFRRLDVPMLGMIENMASFVCDECGKTHYPFGEGGAAREAEKTGIPFLGPVPLDLDIRKAGDGGAPIVVSKPDSPQSAAFRNIARKLAKHLL